MTANGHLRSKSFLAIYRHKSLSIKAYSKKSMHPFPRSSPVTSRIEDALKYALKYVL